MASSSAVTASPRAKRWLFYLEQALPEVSLHLINVGDRFGYIKFGFSNGNVQGLLLLDDRKRIGQVKNLIMNEAHVIPMTLQIKAHSSQLDALDNVTESGNSSLLGMQDANSSFDDEIEFAKDFYCEHGEEAFYERFPRLILRNKGIIPYMQKIRAYRQGDNIHADNLALRQWQTEVVAALSSQGERKILWIYDKTGNSGKSWLARSLDSQNSCIILSNGKESDLAQAVNGQRLIIFDFARAEQGRISYSAIEHIKNGRVFSTKYSSQVKSFKPPAIVIFSNFLPSFQEFSLDRWDCREVVQENGDFKLVPIDAYEQVNAN